VLDLATVVKAFEERYIDEYGAQAMAPRGGLQIITIAVELVGSTPKPKLSEFEIHGESPAKALKGERDIYFDGRFRKCKIYSMEKLLSGNLVPGPSVIEASDTTVVVPEDRMVLIDRFQNMVMKHR
jgi:N-methylhydantoinase A/oxoprolinase/acetone carboxylase beta subunit